MKSCFIVNYWADTDEKVEMVVNGMLQLKKTGRDIIYTSLCPIDKKISEISTYSIFHNKNDLISLFDLLDNGVTLSHNTSLDTNSFRFFSTSLDWKDVGFSVSTQLVNNLKVLKSLGYTHFHFFVGDCFVTDEELDVFSHIEQSCQLYNKKAYFDDLTHRFDGYGAIYFSSDINFFLEHFLPVSTKDNFIKTNAGGTGIFCFEKILKNCFEGYSKDLLLGKNDSDSFGHSVLFKTSKLDIVSTYNTKTEYHILPNIDYSLSYIFIVSREDANYVTYIDDEVYEQYLPNANWCYYVTDKKQFNFKIVKNGIVAFEERITNERLKRIHSYTFFDANKRNI